MRRKRLRNLVLERSLITATEIFLITFDPTVNSYVVTSLSVYFVIKKIMKMLKNQ